MAHGDRAKTYSLCECIEQADLIVSAVTASQAVPVAKACAAGVRTGTFFLDFNSASPGAKSERNGAVFEKLLERDFAVVAQRVEQEAVVARVDDARVERAIEHVGAREQLQQAVELTQRRARAAVDRVGDVIDHEERSLVRAGVEGEGAEGVDGVVVRERPGGVRVQRRRRHRE